MPPPGGFARSSRQNVLAGDCCAPNRMGAVSPAQSGFLIELYSPRDLPAAVPPLWILPTNSFSSLSGGKVTIFFCLTSVEEEMNVPLFSKRERKAFVTHQHSMSMIDDFISFPIEFVAELCIRLLTLLGEVGFPHPAA